MLFDIFKKLTIAIRAHDANLFQFKNQCPA